MDIKMRMAGMALAALAGGFGTGALAERGGPMAGFLPDFSAVDTNGDGLLSQEELVAAMAARRAAIDTDANGSISAAEVAAERVRRAPAEAEAFVAAHDRNGDGVLSGDEMPAPRDPDRFFRRLDANGDGGISQAELDGAKERMRHHRGRHGTF